MSDQKNIEKKLSESRVRIITHQNVRYEGILYQINSKEKTVALKNVKSFGTEDRPTDKVVGAKERIYEFIVFRSDEIQNLAVLKDDEQPSETQEQEQQTQQEQENKQEEKQEDEKKDEVEQPQEVQQQQKQEVVAQQQQVQQTQQHQQKSKKKYQKQKFEFNEMVDNLDKIQKQKESGQQQSQNYNQDDFFDNLTTSVNERRGDNHYYKYKTTKETFGYVPNKSNNYRRSGYKRHNNYKRRGRGKRNQNNYNGRRQNQQDSEFEYVKKTQ